MKIVGSWLGTMSQQFGKSIVFFDWKGIQAARKYKYPTITHTAPQMAQRTLFGTVLAGAQQILIPILHKFWKKQAVKMSNFNAFMKVNMKVMFPLWNPALYVFSQGSLFKTLITTAIFDPITGIVDITFPNTATGNQTVADLMVALIVDKSTRLIYYDDSGINRLIGNIGVTTEPALNPANLSAFLFAYRDLGSVSEYISTSTMHGVV